MGRSMFQVSGTATLAGIWRATSVFSNLLIFFTLDLPSQALVSFDDNEIYDQASYWRVNEYAGTPKASDCDYK